MTSMKVELNELLDMSMVKNKLVARFSHRLGYALGEKATGENPTGKRHRYPDESVHGLQIAWQTRYTVG